MALGNHFFVWRRFRGMPFQHHAIDVGDGTAVHFSDGQTGVATPGGDTTQFVVLRTTMDALSRGGLNRLHIVEHPLVRTEDEVVQRALAQVGRRGYHLLFHNCEHFASWCVIGSEASRQVEIACERMASAGLKTVVSSTAKVASRVGVRGLSRGFSPWMLASDAIQWATEAGGHHVGLRSPRRRQQVSRAVGAATALGIGALAGPAGIAVASGTWLAGEFAGHISCRVYDRARDRHRIA